MKNTWWIAPVVAMAILLIFVLLPPLSLLTPLGMKVVGILFFTIILWVFVGISYPSLISLALFAVLGVMTPKELFAVSMGNWIVIFIIACLGLADGLRATGFSCRFALWFMSRPFTRNRPWMLLAMTMLASTILGAIMSSTAAFIVFMSVVTPMLEAAGYKKGDHFATVFMMGLAWATTAAFMITPIGHGSNVLLIEWVERDIGYIITFAKWIAVGIPVGLLIYILVLGILRLGIRPDVSQFSASATEYVAGERDKLGRITLEEKLAVGIFLGVVVCWVLPGVVSGILPGISAYLKEIGYAVPALIGAGLLCIIRTKNQPLLSFTEWMRNMEWGAIMLIIAIMAIGAAIGTPGTGIPELLTGIFTPIAQNAPFPVFLFVSILWAGFQTNIMSNLVTAILVYTIMVPAAIAAGIGNPAALGFSIFAATRSAFAFPSATVVTALVIGSGWVPVGFMLRWGLITIIPIVLVIAFICYPLAAAIFS
ncbi:SLC13 family permease [Chloroflexota bacterium]